MSSRESFFRKTLSGKFSPRPIEKMLHLTPDSLMRVAIPYSGGQEQTDKHEIESAYDHT